MSSESIQLPFRFVLASQSPRRSQILRDAGFEFDIVVSPIDEPNDMGPHVPPHAQAEALSYFKARSVALLGEKGVILGADTIVAHDGKIFGKPSDVADARRILTSLFGTRHDVITGVTLFDTDSDVRLITHERTVVQMRPMSDEELNSYLDTGQWQGKAGAYGIQDSGDAFVTALDGSFSNVVGLPIDTVKRMIDECVQKREAAPSQNDCEDESAARNTTNS